MRLQLDASTGIRSPIVRILVWNMGAGSPGGSTRHVHGWEHLRERDDFDIALLQETRQSPEWTTEQWPWQVWQPKYPIAPTTAGSWGSGVISRSDELEAYV